MAGKPAMTLSAPSVHAHAAAGPEIERLIQLLARLPGLGPRSARRAALHLIKKREQLMAPLSAALQTRDREDRGLRHLRQHRHADPCTVCADAAARPLDPGRGGDVADLWALERARGLNARYHVLGGTLSPLDGVGPHDSTIDALVARAHDPAVQGGNAGAQRHRRRADHGALHHRSAADASVKVTRLAHGVPVGGELDYLDEGTLAAAIRSGRRFNFAQFDV